MTGSCSATGTNGATLRSLATATMAVLCICSVASGFTTMPSQLGTPGDTTAMDTLFRLPVSASADNNGMNFAAVARMSSSASNNVPQQPRQQRQQQLEWDWRSVVQEAWKLDPRPIIMFDGDCNLCNGGVNMLLDMDTDNVFRFCSLSSKFGQSLLVAHGKQPDDKDNIMVIEQTATQQPNTGGNIQSHFLQKSEAVMTIASRLGGAPSWVKAMTKVGTVAPAQVSDWLLQIIADNRHRISDTMAGEDYDSCRLDLDGEFDGRFLNDYEHLHLFEPYDPEADLKKKFNDIIFS